MPELIKTILKNSTNLKAYYQFSAGGLTTDNSGNSHTLTAISDPAEGTGVYGGCVDLDGNDAYSIADHADLKPTGSFTVGYWIKTSTNGYQRHFQSYYGNPNLAGILIQQDTNVTQFRVGSNTGTTENTHWKQVSVTNSTIYNGSWHFIVATYDGAAMRLYQDGAIIGTTASTINPGYDANVKQRIGCANSSGTNDGFLSGSLDDLFLLNGTALSADQIKELYEGRYLGELRPNQFGTTAALYHLSSTTDAGGNNYHLTNTNSVGFVAGKFGNCADFGSSNTNKQLSVADPMSINGGAISVSLWVKAQTEIGSGAYGFFIHGNNTSQTAYGVNYEYNSGTRRLGFFRTQYAVGKTQGNYTTTLGTTSWHHIVLTYDTTNIGGYLNGSLVVTQAASGNGGGTYLNGLILGSENGANYSSVFMDEVHVSSTALTANQIRQIYALGVGKYY